MNSRIREKIVLALMTVGIAAMLILTIMTLKSENNVKTVRSCTNSVEYGVRSVELKLI